MAVKADLDAIDWKILRELQDDGRITNVELSQSRRHFGAAVPAPRQAAGGERHHPRLSRHCSTARRSAWTSSPSAWSASTISRKPN